MRLFTVSAIFSAALSAVSAAPQTSVSVNDLVKGAQNARYGEDSGAIDPDVLNELFGAPATPPGDSGEPNGYVDGNDIDVDVKDTSCSSYADYGFHCVEYYQCKGGLIIKDGSGLFDIRSNFASLDPTQSKCPGALEVCCRDSDYEGLELPTVRPPVTQPPEPITPLPPTEPPITQAPITQAPITQAPITNPPTDPVTQTATDLPPGVSTNEPYIPPVDPVTPVITIAPVPVTPVTPVPEPLRQCGRRNAGGIGVRIQNNNEDYFGTTQFGEWPHMCAILKKGEVGGKEVNFYVGGASLIHPGIALTAAHIVYDFVNEPENLKVRCGEWDTRQVIEPLKHEDRNATTVSVHPAYNKRNLQNDFALLHLEYDFILQDHINTICLPNEFTPFRSEGCFATGWGKDKFGKSGNYQEILKQVPLDLVRKDQCQEELRQTRLGKLFELDQSFTCAGGEPNEDTCKGDGGGPLVCPINDDHTYPQPQHYVQTGIVAWGIGCGNEVPGVYADVTEGMCFIDWSTKCVHGQDRDYYEMTGCGENWAKQQYCKAKADLEYAQTPVERKKLEYLLSQYQPAILGCKYGPYYGNTEIDCGGGDIADFARDSTGLAQGTNPRFGGTTPAPDSSAINFGKR